MPESPGVVQIMSANECYYLLRLIELRVISVETLKPEYCSYSLDF